MRKLARGFAPFAAAAVAEIFVMRWRDMGEIVPAEVGDAELAEDVVEHACGVLDRVVAHHDSCRLEAYKGEGFDEFLEWHAVLQTDGYRDGEIVHQAAERSTFLVHVYENFADTTILVFAGAQIHLMAADHRFLRVPLAALGQALAFAADDALDDFLDHAFGNHRCARRLRQ